MQRRPNLLFVVCFMLVLIAITTVAAFEPVTGIGLPAGMLAAGLGALGLVRTIKTVPLEHKLTIVDGYGVTRKRRKVTHHVILRDEMGRRCQYVQYGNAPHRRCGEVGLARVQKSRLVGFDVIPV